VFLASYGLCVFEVSGRQGRRFQKYFHPSQKPKTISILRKNYEELIKTMKEFLGVKTT